MVVLSGETLLYEAIRHAAGERTAVWHARSAAESVDLLLSGRCGVLLVDMAAMSTEPDSFVRQILEQFPDVVVVAAGQREDEPRLAPLVSEGLVYRFMHKPISPRRARMFLDAAVRCHVGRRAGGSARPMLPLGGSRRSRLDPGKWLFVGGGILAFVALLAALQFARQDVRDEVRQPRPAVAVPSPGPLSDPVLSRARAAFGAGRDEAPPGRNALDLYSAVLLSRPDDAEARAGLAATADRIMARADNAARIGNRREAQRLATRVLDASPGHAGARALLRRLEPPRKAAPQAAKIARVAPVAAPQGPPALRPQVAPARKPPRAEAKVNPPVQAATAPPPRAVPSTATRTPVVATARVQPDPLTPRLVSKPAATPSSPGSTSRGGPRSYGAPVSSGHYIAGYLTRQPEIMIAAAPREAAVAWGDGEPVVLRDLEALSLADPVYPARAWQQRIEGWVEVEYTVTAQGSTSHIEVVAAEPRGVFEAAATAAVARWSFRPRMVNGQPVAQRTAVTLRFSVED
jgi:protein TonB